MIELKDITKIYRKSNGIELEVLRGINFEINRGDYVAIMASSGAGKSTLLNIIGCLERPTSGSYLFDSMDVGRMDDDELSRTRNKRLGFIFQSFNLLPKTTAIENVELPLIYSPEDLDARTLAKEALDSVGLGDRLSHFPEELSGGQQQRVAIARALVNDPDLILADEPTGSLDAAAREEVMDVFWKLNRDGRTIVLVTHDPDVAERAERIVMIRDGRIAGDERRLKQCH